MTPSKTLVAGFFPSLLGGVSTFHLLHIMGPKRPGGRVYVPKTYGRLFRERNWRTVEGNTGDEQMGNILLGRMFPHHRRPHTLAQNQLFPGSPAMTIGGRENGGGMFVLGGNNRRELGRLREACLRALGSFSEREDPNFHRIREWCTTSTVEDVLRRHRFGIAKGEKDFRMILEGEWFRDDSYREKQSFFSDREWKDLKDPKKGWETLKSRCEGALRGDFRRSNFPTPKVLLGGEKADEFQEAAMFCTVPITAEEYVKRAMQGTIRESLGDHMKEDRCRVGAKDVEYYRNIKTNDPMEGKSFWCAVRLIYFRSDKRK